MESGGPSGAIPSVADVVVQFFERVSVTLVSSATARTHLLKQSVDMRGVAVMRGVGARRIQAGAWLVAQGAYFCLTARASINSVLCASVFRYRWVLTNIYRRTSNNLIYFVLKISHILSPSLSRTSCLVRSVLKARVARV